MKILHLIIDHQVIERTLSVYESVCQCRHDVIVFGVNNNFKHLNTHRNAPFVGYKEGLPKGKEFCYDGYTQIIAHYMTMDMIDFIKSAPVSLHVCWEVYGYDLYNQFLFPLGMQLYYSDTLKYLKYTFFRKHFAPLFDILAELKGYKYMTKTHIKRQFDYITHRVDSIQYCCKYDAEQIKDYSGRHIHSYEIFNYSLDEVLGELKNAPFTSGRDIMVGNSASYSNNHMYILELLKSMKFDDDIRMIVPISYGGCEKYADDVEITFKETFIGMVNTLREYMPLHEYNKIFLRLNSMILSAWRQESQGTAIMGFYLGIKVFMSQRSPLYKWFKDCGFVVFSIEDATANDLQTPLPLKDRENNRCIVLERYNDAKTRETFKTEVCNGRNK